MKPGAGAGDAIAEETYDSYLSTTYAHRNDLSPEGLARSAQAHAREFGSYLPTDRAAPVLEIGCGAGGFLLCCRERGHLAVEAIDRSREQVEFCRRLGFEGVLEAEALEFLERSGRSYALILMSDVLEHLPKERVIPTLRAAAARLRPDGRLVLRVPNLSNPLNLRTRYVDFTHEVGFSQESLAQVLRIAGLEVESVRGAFYPHRRLLARWLFDGLLWRLFLLLHRHLFHLKDEPVRGKNLIAVARPAAGRAAA